MADQTDPKTLNRGLTKPRSPNLSTLNRIKLKDDLSVASADKIKESNSVHEFKARPFNKKIFE